MYCIMLMIILTTHGMPIGHIYYILYRHMVIPIPSIYNLAVVAGLCNMCNCLRLWYTL